MKPPVAETTAVIVNGRAGRTLRDPRLLARLSKLVPSEQVLVTSEPKEVAPALRSIRRSGVDTLVIVGGDGTVTGTLSPLFQVWDGEPLPSIVLTRGGTINTIASSLGASGNPAQELARLLRSARLLVSERPVLEIHTDAGRTERVAHGLIFANGGATRFLEQYYESRERGALQAAATLARVLASASVNGRTARDLLPPFEARVRVDGDAFSERRFTIMAASGVEHIGLGFRPFFSAATRPDRFHWSSTRGTARQIGLEIPWVGLGARRPGSCLTHASPRQVEIETLEPQGYTIDGDLFPPSAHVVIRASRPVRFVRAPA